MTRMIKFMWGVFESRSRIQVKFLCGSINIYLCLDWNNACDKWDGFGEGHL